METSLIFSNSTLRDYRDNLRCLDDKTEFQELMPESDEFKLGPALLLFSNNTTTINIYVI